MLYEVITDNIIKRVSCGDYKNFHIFPRINDRESGQLLKANHCLHSTEINIEYYP